MSLPHPQNNEEYYIKLLNAKKEIDTNLPYIWLKQQVFK